MQNASIFFVGNFRDGDLLAIGCQHAKVVHLSAAGGIKSRAVKHDGGLAIAVKSFDHASVEVVEKRIVVVEAVSHWEAIRGQHLELGRWPGIIVKQQTSVRAPSHCALIDLRNLDQRRGDLIAVHGEYKIMEKRAGRVALERRSAAS